MAGDPVARVSDAGFEVVKRGYDQVQVDEHLRRLDAEIRILATDREAAVDQSGQLARELDETRARTERLRAQVRTLVSPPQSIQGMSERMRSMLRLAEDEVVDMIARAESEVNRRIRAADVRATETRTSAQADADSLRSAARADAEQTGRDLARSRAEFEARRRAAEEQLATDRSAMEQRAAADAARAEQERASAWSESEARRAVVEEDFTIAMDQRRSAALSKLTAEYVQGRRDVAQTRESAASAARELIAQAENTARRMVTEAERQVAELMALRRRISQQLDGARSHLDHTLDRLGPLPGEESTRQGQESAGPAGGSSPAQNGVGGGPRPPARDQSRSRAGSVRR